jgi:putative heme iron utilization protein
MRRMTSITPRAEPLPEPGAGDHPALARALLREALTASLATLDPGGGHPFVSLVTVATDHDGAPLLLASRLALHSRNMAADGRVSLLLARGGRGDPLAHPRLTLSGLATPAEAPHLRGRFLARHPKAALYIDFSDFRFWRVCPLAAHLVAGFGRAPELPPEALLTDTQGAEALLTAEPALLSQLDPETVGRIAARHGAAMGAWRLTGLDPEGIDLLDGERALRIRFPTRVTDPAMLATVLR